MTFFGPERLPDPSSGVAHHGTDEPEAAHHSGADAHGHAADQGHGHDSHFGHESPPVMTIPLVILAICAVVVGIAFGPTKMFEHHLEHTAQLAPAEHGEAVVHAPDRVTPIVGTLVGLAGLALSYLLYALPSPVPARLAGQLRPLYQASLHKFYVDEFYNHAVVWPTRFLGYTAEFLDRRLVDGLVQGISWIPRLVGRHVLGPIQNGLIQYYAAVTALSVGALLLALLFFV